MVVNDARRGGWHYAIVPIGIGMRLGLVYESVVNGVQGQFEAVGDAELVEDVVQVVLDGLLGNEKLFADFLVAETLRDELNNFFFAVAEQRLFAARAGVAGLRRGI